MLNFNVRWTQFGPKLLILTVNVGDLEVRSYCNNIRIIRLPKEYGLVNEATISTLLEDAFGLEKEPVVDGAHDPYSLNRNPASVHTPHYHVFIIMCIVLMYRGQSHIKVRDSIIFNFPVLTARTAQAGAAFNDIRRQLRDVPSSPPDHKRRESLMNQQFL